MFKEYPKYFQLKTGETASIRPLEQRDRENLHEFFVRLPQRDVMYLKEDVKNIDVINRWFSELNFKKVIPLVVLIEDKIIADGTLHIDEFGWARHIGEIRLVVDKDYRKINISKFLLRELYFIAMKMNLEKLVGKMMVDQKRAVEIFKELGFKKEATLKNHIKDRKGKNHDMVIMSHMVDAHWKELEDMMGQDDFSGDFSGM